MTTSLAVKKARESDKTTREIRWASLLGGDTAVTAAKKSSVKKTAAKKSAVGT